MAGQGCTEVLPQPPILNLIHFQPESQQHLPRECPGPGEDAPLLPTCPGGLCEVRPWCHLLPSESQGSLNGESWFPSSEACVTWGPGRSRGGGGQGSVSEWGSPLVSPSMASTLPCPHGPSPLASCTPWCLGLGMWRLQLPHTLLSAAWALSKASGCTSPDRRRPGRH